MKLRQGATKYLTSLKQQGRSTSTLRAYKTDTDQFVKFLKNPDLENVDQADIERFMSHMNERKFTNKTISRKLNSVKALFKFLVNEKLRQDDPALKVPHPVLKEKTPRVLKPQEFRSLRDISKDNNRLSTMIELMLQTGLRIGEISRLKITDIKLNSRQLIVQDYSGNPMRIVDLSDKATETLSTYLEKRPQVDPDLGYLFTTKNGGSMNIRNIRSAINRAFKKAEITDATVNDIRNTFIAQQLEAGVSLGKVAQIVGHKRYASTEKFMDAVVRNKPGNGDKLVSID